MSTPEGRDAPPPSGRDDAVTLKDDDPADDEVTKLAPLTAAAAAVAGEVAHSSDVQRAAARARVEAEAPKGAPPSPASADDVDEPTKLRPSDSRVPNLAFDEAPRREQTALMPTAPGRVVGSSSRMPVHPPTGMAPPPPFPPPRPDALHAPFAVQPSPSFASFEADTKRWWILVAAFAVFAVAVPFAVYFALREDPGDAPAESPPTVTPRP